MAFTKAFGASGSASSYNNVTTSRAPQRDGSRTPFGHAMGRFSIGSLDNERLTVWAQFNPKELTVERGVNWKQGDQRDNRPDWLRAKSGRTGHADGTEYTGAETRTMSFELLLDGYEEKLSIENEVQALEEMACVRDPESREDSMRRPHHCVVVFGDKQSNGGMAKFRCVITKLSVKYSMFSNHGVPLRATVNITVKEAFRLEGLSKSADEAANEANEKRRKDRY